MATTDEANDALERFYVTDDPQITEQARAILTQYSGIREEELVAHIRKVRDKAWATFKYPCIGMYNFLNFAIASSSRYQETLERLNHGDTLLDLGCCFGQDIRKLVVDGAPAENITGSELEAVFIEAGFDLFLDKEKLRSTFKPGDFLGPDMAGLVAHSFDMIQAAAFFHLFSWEEQSEAFSRAISLLKPKSGSMIFGRQTGVQDAGTIKHRSTRSGVIFRHNEESFKKLVEEVSAKDGIKLNVEVQSYHKQDRKEVEDWLMLNFCITLQ